MRVRVPSETPTLKGTNMQYTDPIVKTDFGYFFILNNIEHGPFINREAAEKAYKEAYDFYNIRKQT